MAGNAGKIQVTLSVSAEQAVAALRSFEGQVKKTAESVKGSADKMKSSFDSVKGPKLNRTTKDLEKTKRQFDKTTDASKRLASQNKLTATSFAKFAIGAAIAARVAKALFRLADAGAQYSLRIAEIATLTDESNFSTEEQRRIVESVSEAYGEKFLQTAPALYDAISAGATNAAEATATLDNAVKLSIATVSTQAQAVSLLVGTLNAYGNEVGGAAEVTDDFFAIVRQGKLRLEELDPAIGRVTPLAKAAGVSFKELGAAIVALTRSGSSASEAITKIRSILNASIKKQKDFDESFQKIGLRFDSTTIKANGFKNTLELLRRSTGNSNEELGSLIGRVEGVAGILALTDDNSRLFSEALDGMANSAGAADQAFNELRGSTGRQFEELKNLASNIKTGIGEAFASAVISIKNALSESKDFLQVLDEIDKKRRGIVDKNPPSDISLEALNKAVSAASDIPVTSLGKDQPSIEKLAREIQNVIDAIGGLDSRFRDFFRASTIGFKESARAAVEFKTKSQSALFGPSGQKLLIDIPEIVISKGKEKEFLDAVLETLRAQLKEGVGNTNRVIRTSVINPIIAELDKGTALAFDTAAIVNDSKKGVMRFVSSIKVLSASEVKKAKLGEEVSNAFKASMEVVFGGKAVSAALPKLGDVGKGQSLSLSATFGVEQFKGDIADLSAPFNKFLDSLKNLDEPFRGISAEITNSKGGAEAITTATQQERDAASKALAERIRITEEQLKATISQKVANDLLTEQLDLQVKTTGVGGKELVVAKERSKFLDKVSRSLTEVLALEKDIGIITGDTAGETDKQARLKRVVLDLNKASAFQAKVEAAAVEAFTDEQDIASRTIDIRRERSQANTLFGIEKQRALAAVASKEALLSFDKLVRKQPEMRDALQDELDIRLKEIDAGNELASITEEQKRASAEGAANSLDARKGLGLSSKIKEIELSRDAEIRALQAIRGAEEGRQKEIDRQIASLKILADIEIKRAIGEQEATSKKIEIRRGKSQANILVGLEKRRALAAVASKEALLAFDTLVRKHPELRDKLQQELDIRLKEIEAGQELANIAEAQKRASAEGAANRLESTIGGGLSSQVKEIQIRRDAEIRALQAITGAEEGRQKAIDRQIAALKTLADIDIQRAQVVAQGEINNAVAKNVELEAMLGDIRGTTSALFIAQSKTEIQQIEQKIELAKLEGEGGKEIVAVLERELELRKNINEVELEQVQFNSGELGFFESFSIAMDMASDDVKTLGSLGKSVASTFNSLTRSWISGIADGGNAWESFKDQVLRGLLDIAAQWAIMGIINSAIQGLNIAIKSGNSDNTKKSKDAAKDTSDAATKLGQSGQAIASAGSAIDAAGISMAGSAGLTLVAALVMKPVADELVVAGGLLLAAAVLLSAGGGGATPAKAAARGGVIPGEFFNAGDLPVNMFAGGGIANSPQLAIFGEGRGAEAFVPLPDGKRIPVAADFSGLLETALALQAAVNRLDRAHMMTVSGAGGAGTQNFSDNRSSTINVSVDARGSSDPEAVDLAVRRGIVESMPDIERSIGRSMLTGRSSALVNGVRGAAGVRG